MISQEASASSAHLQLDLFYGFTHQQPTQMEHKQPSYTCTHQRTQTQTDRRLITHKHTHTKSFIIVHANSVRVTSHFGELYLTVKKIA